MSEHPNTLNTPPLGRGGILPPGQAGETPSINRTPLALAAGSVLLLAFASPFPGRQ